MKIKQILKPDCVLVEKTASSKKQLLEKLAHLAAEKTGLDDMLILNALVERERLGTTGIGRGVALLTQGRVGICDAPTAPYPCAFRTQRVEIYIFHQFNVCF